jgi:hypothetical protein
MLGILDMDALVLADVSKVTLNADGTATGAREAVVALRERKPHLFRKHVRDMSEPEYQAALAKLVSGSR